MEFLKVETVVAHICEFLSYASIQSLRIAYPPVSKLIPEWMIDVRYLIGRRLENFGIDPNHFFNVLKKSNHMISGSFLLQCVHDEEYENSDIDVYGYISSKEISPPKYERHDRDMKDVEVFREYVSTLTNDEEMLFKGGTFLEKDCEFNDYPALPIKSYKYNLLPSVKTGIKKHVTLNHIEISGSINELVERNIYHHMVVTNENDKWLRDSFEKFRQQYVSKIVRDRVNEIDKLPMESKPM
jgi:hypothetical protein